MKIYIVNCTFNLTQTVIDCAFLKAADADAYINALNEDKAKAPEREEKVRVKNIPDAKPKQPKPAKQTEEAV